MESLRWLLGKIRALLRSFRRPLVLLLLFLILLYYPIGMAATNRIDDDPGFTASAKFDVSGGSHAVAMEEALIEREIRHHHWVPNDPFFYPSYLLIRMPAFQRGIVAGVSRFSLVFSEQPARTRNPGQDDPNLEKAAALLKYSPTVWVFDFATSLLPATPSEEQYLAAEDALRKYNERLAKGQVAYERTPDTLARALEAIAADMESSAAAMDSHIHSHSGSWFDGTAASQFYFVKGRMYADYLLMRELRRDFPDIMKGKALNAPWDTALDSLLEGASLSHFLVIDAAPQSALLPNHLAVQGFYLSRAQAQLHALINILLK